MPSIDRGHDRDVSSRANLAVADAFEGRKVENARRLAAGLAPKTRRRRRKVIAELVGTASPR